MRDIVDPYTEFHSIFLPTLESLIESNWVTKGSIKVKDIIFPINEDIPKKHLTLFSKIALVIGVKTSLVYVNHPEGDFCLSFRVIGYPRDILRFKKLAYGLWKASKDLRLFNNKYIRRSQTNKLRNRDEYLNKLNRGRISSEQISIEHGLIHAMIKKTLDISYITGNRIYKLNKIKKYISDRNIKIIKPNRYNYAKIRRGQFAGFD